MRDQAYGTVSANEDAPLVHEGGGAGSDDFSAVEAGSVAAACPTAAAADCRR